MSELKSSLHEVVPGDTVIERSSFGIYSQQTFRTTQVLRVTATQVTTTGGSRYMKSTGYLVGGSGLRELFAPLQRINATENAIQFRDRILAERKERLDTDNAMNEIKGAVERLRKLYLPATSLREVARTFDQVVERAQKEAEKEAKRE